MFNFIVFCYNGVTIAGLQSLRSWWLWEIGYLLAFREGWVSVWTYFIICLKYEHVVLCLILLTQPLQSFCAEFLRRPPINKTSELVEKIIKSNDTKRVKSYVEAGCINSHDGMQNVSKCECNGQLVILNYWSNCFWAIEILNFWQTCESFLSSRIPTRVHKQNSFPHVC